MGFKNSKKQAREEAREQRPLTAEEAAAQLRNEAAALRRNFATMLKVVINQASHWKGEADPEQRFANLVECVFAFGEAASRACPSHEKEAWEAACLVACQTAADDAIMGDHLGFWVALDGRRLLTNGKVRMLSALFGMGVYSEQRKEGSTSGISGTCAFEEAPKIGQGEEIDQWIVSASAIVVKGLKWQEAADVRTLCETRKGACSWPRPAEQPGSKMSRAEAAAMAWLGEVLPMLHGEVRRPDALAMMVPAAEALEQAALLVERPSKAYEVDRMIWLCKEGMRLLEHELASSGRAGEWLELNEALMASTAASWAAAGGASLGAAKHQIVFDAITAELKSGLIPASQAAIAGILGPLSIARARLYALSEAAELRAFDGDSPRPARRSLRM